MRRSAGGVGGLLLTATLMCPACGCARRAEVVLRQPFAPPSQQNLKLIGDWASHTAEGGRQTCLLAFPLPRAQVGTRAWVLYISAPDGLGTRTVERDAAGTETGGNTVRGFLIQEVGDLAGRTDFAAGTVRFRGVWLAPHRRMVELDLRCEDGTEIRGRALLDDAASEVHAFERQYAADIGLLWARDTQPVSGAPTGRRSATSH
jgi:hypothetical protein